MAKKLLLACLACLATSVQAAPVTFFNTQFDATALASAGAAFDLQTTPPTPPGTLIATADPSGTSDPSALAVASNLPGLLSTLTDAFVTTADFASAAATSHFQGSFITTGHLILNLDFLQNTSAVGTGSGDSGYHVGLTIGGVPFLNFDVTPAINDPFTSDTRHYSFETQPGSTGILDVSIFSEAGADGVSGPGGSGNSFASLNFTAVVPQPGTWWLLLIGMAAFGIVQRGRHASPQPA
jgi:hypothetical protein